MSDTFHLFQLTSNFASLLLCSYILVMLKMLFSWLPSRSFLVAFFAIKIVIALGLICASLIDSAFDGVLYLLSLPLVLLIGPLLVRFTHSTIEVKTMPLLSNTNKILFFSGLVCLMPFVLFPNTSVNTESNLGLMQATGQIVFIALFLLSSSYYFLPFIWRFYRGKLYGPHFSENTYQWLKGVWLSFTLIWLTIVIDFISDIFDHHPLWRDVLAFIIDLASVVIITLYTARYCKREDFVKESETFAIAQKYEKSGLTQEHAEKILTELDRLMSEEELYLDCDLTLDKVAKRCASQPKYVSQALNQVRAINFYEYIATFRVEYAKKQLLQTRFSILEIAMNAGFNAKSTFNNTFKKLTDQTPSKYREENIAV